MAGHWNSKILPRGVLDAPSLESCEARLDAILGILIWWCAKLLAARGLEPDAIEGPLHPKPFCWGGDKPVVEV